MGKLTKAQREFLQDLFDTTSMGCTETYKPMQKLVALGYAVFDTDHYGYGRARITPAGRTALKDQAND